MRNIDELLQDIPLDELLEGTDKSREKQRPSRQRIKHTAKKKEPVKLKSRVYAGAAAAVLALVIGASAIVIVGSRGTRPSPKASISEFQADPISLPDDNVSSRKNEQLSSIDSSEAGHAKVIFNAVQKYLDEFEGFVPMVIRNQGELYIDFKKPSDDVKSFVAKLEELSGCELDVGYAFIGFNSDNELLFAEWTEKQGAEVELYQQNGRGDLTYSLGDYPNEYYYAVKGENTYGTVDITCLMSGSTQSVHVSRVTAKGIIEAYRHLLRGKTVRSSLTDWLEEGDEIKISFMYFGERVNITASGNYPGSFTVNEFVSFDTTDDTLLETALKFVFP